MGSNSDVNSPKPVILLTGFGPFREHFINASWQVAQSVKFDSDEFKFLLDNYNLVKREIPVSYAVVDRTIPELWSTYRPFLVVHCGVSALAKCLILECQAHRNNYCAPDVDNCTPKRSETNGLSNGTANLNGETNEVCKEVPLRCGLDLGAVSHAVNKRCDTGELEVPAIISHDAGRYLCEYIFCKSLEQDTSRTVFVHVPPLDKPYSRQALAKTLEVIIVQLVNQLAKCECP